ncbi:MAG: glycine--tRNA ligase subunit beta [Candidatus Aminicenantes bacterium]|jgi:glycyl-tRNA synthetase beta chain
MEFFLEINTEEMPSSHIISGISQLRDKLEEILHSSSISFSRIKNYGTCRRLVIVGNFAPEQKDRVEDIIGPPRAAAFDENGVARPAAAGFARKHGLSVEKLVVLKTDKGEYVGARKIIKGAPTEDILREGLPKIIASLSFPKMMRWGESPLKFSRPIQNILCIFGEKPLLFRVGEISSSDFTTGHKIFSPKKVKPASFSEYRKTLADLDVIIDPDKRKRMILRQAEKKLMSLGAQIYPDDELLDKLSFDVESPYVILGSFPEEYLKLPLEVLSTAMKEGQNLFSVVKGKKQLPYFIGVADVPDDSKSLIREGNERVLKARLEDARFFWEQDLRIKLRKRAEGLDRVIYQEKLGSYDDKAQRLKKIGVYLANKLEAKGEKKSVADAAELCKADLLTEMVREFPTLQGQMGGLYAKEEGYLMGVWRAIYEHYQPLSMDDAVPSSFSGALLSVADKLDSIVGAVGVGMEVSGSKDPFGLRRNAQGICKIILEKKIDIDFSRLVDKVIAIYGEAFEQNKRDIKNRCFTFFKGRLQHIFESQGFRYDLVNAALSPGIDNIYYTYLRLKALDSLKESAHFEPMILIAKRVNNILRDQTQKFKVNSELLFEKEERELYTTFSIIRENALEMIARGDFTKAQRMAFRIRSSINSFFDNVLVMVDDRRLKRNRLALLQAISKLLNEIADYSQIVISD